MQDFSSVSLCMVCQIHWIRMFGTFEKSLPEHMNQWDAEENTLCENRIPTRIKRQKAVVNRVKKKKGKKVENDVKTTQYGSTHFSERF